MIKIALCDDNPAELEQLHLAVLEVAKRLRLDISCCRFNSGDKLVDAVQAGQSFDLCVMDVVMPGRLGTAAAREICKACAKPSFIFLTTSRDFAVDAYDLEALDYIMKPVEAARLERAVSKFVKSRTKKDATIVIKGGFAISQIAVSDLCYVEKFDHNLIYHTARGEELSCRQSLADAEAELLLYSNFIKPSRSYLVNMDYIKNIEQGCITMKNGDKIYASRASAKDLSRLFLKHKFCGEETDR